MSKFIQLNREELQSDLNLAECLKKRVAYYDVPADAPTSDATVTLPEQILTIQDGEFYALYAEEAGAVRYQYLQDLLNDHSIEYGDDAHEWLRGLRG